MTALFVTVDLGNTRCKLRAWQATSVRAAQITASADLAVSSALVHEVLRWASDLPRGAVCVGSSVAAPSLERELAGALETALQARARFDAPSGLAVAVQLPERVGRDRLFAARGAYEVLGRSAIVVDAGTALTVDALRVADGRAEFLGGAIAPGPRLLADALNRHAARLPLVEPRVGVAALGRDTEQAVQAGVVIGFRGAARELALCVAAESGLADAEIVVTGGARAFLLAPRACFVARFHEDAELVHRGLLAAALDLENAG